MKCPHADCGKKFDKLIMIVDQSRVPRETYYACPHCRKRIDVTVKPESLEFPSHSRSLKREDSSGCPHYLGYLKLFSSRAQIPEECLTCKRLMECMDKKL